MWTELQPWDALMKRIVWLQMGNIEGKKILDFGSGVGVTADHFAKDNEVIALEPCEEYVEERWENNTYQQIVGGLEELSQFEDELFDLIICHNVLEYAADREDIMSEFGRVLKSGGTLSLVKHNRPGRVMQMVVLLNDFEGGHHLLDGNDGMTSRYGSIRYYDDADVEEWCPELHIKKTLGIRTFWDLQQNQELHGDPEWQDKMVDIEMRVSDRDEYKIIAFFHHLVVEKK